MVDTKLQKALMAFPPFTVVVVTFCVSERRLLVLLKRPEWLRTMREWMLVDEGFDGKSGTLESCASTIVTLTTGVIAPAPVPLSIEPRGGRLPGVASLYYASVPLDQPTPAADKMTEYGWFDVNHLPDLAGDDQMFIEEALTALASDEEQVARLSRDVFTVAELLRDMEEVRRLAGIKEPIEKRTLRRHLAAASWLEDTGRMSSGKAHRPAKLYRVK